MCSRYFVQCTRTLSLISKHHKIRGYGNVPYVGIASNNQRINQFVKSGHLDHAMQLFDEMPERDVISWNLVIAGHARHGFQEQALDLFKRMVSLGVEESPTTFCSVLGVCGEDEFYSQGLQVHCRVIRLGLESNFFIGSALVNLYMRIGCPDPARKMFGELSEPNTAVCNSILRGFLELGQVDELIGFFLEMKSMSVDANGVSYSYLIHGCCEREFPGEGKQLHCQVIKLGFAQSDLFVSNALVDFYSAHGNLIDVNISKDSIPIYDIISWNSIVAVEADNGHLLEALESFHMMLELGKKASVRSLVALLNLACRSINLSFGLQLHGFALKSGHFHGSVYVQSALIDMYGKCGKIRRSVSMFDEITEKGIECCNSFITSLLHCNAPEDAIEMFGIMADEGTRPDHVTFSALLRAISNSAFASLVSCQALHGCVMKSGSEAEMSVSSSLISAYSKCGHADVSRQIFEGISSPNIVCFTALIAGYARNGRGKEGLKVFDEMFGRGLKPDALTLLSVLTGCDHSGLVEEGRSVFRSMKAVYGVNPDQRHYSCMVSLLGRAGLVEEAMRLAKSAPQRRNPVMWSSLLQSCRAHGNEEVGRRVTKVLMELEPGDPAIYLQVSGFYSEISGSKRSTSVRESIEASKLRADMGCSLIEVNDRCLDVG